jgi:ech hydrogenase subunit D
MSDVPPRDGADAAGAAEETRRPGPDPQEIEEIPVAGLLERVQRMHAEGWRLVQACCTRLVADQEVSYSFDRDGQSPEARDARALHGMLTLRVRLPMANAELPSISQFYWPAFLYENEMHDLFGISVKDMAIDFKGHFYTTMEPFPFVTKETDHGD